MTLIDIISKAGNRLRHQLLSGCLVRCRQLKSDAEITFATTKDKASDVMKASVLGVSGDYVGIVVWVPADCFEQQEAQKQEGGAK